MTLLGGATCSNVRFHLRVSDKGMPSLFNGGLRGVIGCNEWCNKGVMSGVISTVIKV